VTELFQWKFPGILDASADGALVHMHWIAVSGLVGLISSIFQLLPLDNNTGSKMTYAIFGPEAFTVITAAANIFRVIFLLPLIFTFGNVVDNQLGLKSLLVDFIFASQFAGNPQVSNQNPMGVRTVCAIVSYLIVGEPNNCG
jgi:hypothetical protein